MNPELSRRCLLAVGAIALIDTVVAGHATVQTQPTPPGTAKPPASDPKPAQDQTTKTRMASCNCGQFARP